MCPEQGSRSGRAAGYHILYAGDSVPDSVHDAVARTRLLDLPVGLVEDVRRQGAGPPRSPEAFSPQFQMCLPYRGVFVWHVGGDDVIGNVTACLEGGAVAPMGNVGQDMEGVCQS